MRVCVEKSSGRLLESQSGGDPEQPAHLEAMRRNAEAAGYTRDQVDVRYVEDAEFQQLLGATAPASADQAQADLEAGLARPEIQAILGMLAAQQETTVEALQAQAVNVGRTAVTARSTQAIR